ncbi:MAG: hypothetical protein R2822_04715 [Spirosomataceae bacterium]
MNRFSILYLLQGQYQHTSYPTRAEAEDSLTHFLSNQDGVPLGIYDAKTELFYWDLAQKDKFISMGVEEEDRHSNNLINVIQMLRSQEEGPQDDEYRDGDVLMRPLPLSLPKVLPVIKEIELISDNSKKRKRRPRVGRLKAYSQ